MARPKDNLSRLPEGWKERVTELYKEGASDVEVRAELGLSNDLFYRWLDEEPEFSETIKSGRDISEAWWARVGRLGAVGAQEINPTTWIFNMKNRFNWRDRTESEVKVDGNMRVDLDDDELDERIKQLARKAGISPTA